MIADELEELVQYIGKNVDAGCGIGVRDLGNSEYPYIQIVPDEPFPNFYDNDKLALVKLRVKIKLMVAKSENDVVIAFRLWEQLMQKLNQFTRQKGHKYPDGLDTVPEYTDNTYEITTPYLIQLSVQDTDQ